jgi:hypothetical protein
MIEEYELKNNSIMKRHPKKLSFTKETIAVLNKNALTKILGGSELDPPITSFYSDGPPLTTIAPSDGPPATDISG